MVGPFQETLETCLRTKRLLPKAQRRGAHRLFEGMQAEEHRCVYGSVQRFVRRWAPPFPDFVLYLGRTLPPFRRKPLIRL